MTQAPATEQEYLASYDPKDFDTPLATVDICIFTVFDDAPHVLLVRRGEFPCKDQWALPGGFVDLNADTDLDETAMRKLKEKTGVAASHMEQVATVGNRDRDPRGWSLTILYFALLPKEKVDLRAGGGATEVGWFKVASGAVATELAFDHALLLKKAFARLQNKARYTVLPGYVLPVEFTIPELTDIYRILLEEPLDGPMMRRRLLRAGLLRDTGKMREGPTRPSKLYRFARDASDHVFDRNLEAGGPH